MAARECSAPLSIFSDILFCCSVNRSLKSIDVPRTNPICLGDIFGHELEFQECRPGYPWEPRFRTNADVMADAMAKAAIRRFWTLVRNGEKVSVEHIAELYKGRARGPMTFDTYPLHLRLMEACLCLPVLEQFQKETTPLSFAYEKLSNGRYRLHDRLSKCNFFLYFNFAGFRRTDMRDLIRRAFDILLEKCIDLRQFQGQTAPNSSNIRNIWTFFQDYYVDSVARTDKHGRLQLGDSYIGRLILPLLNWVLIYGAMFKTFIPIQDEILVFDNIIAFQKVIYIPRLVLDLAKYGLNVKIMSNSKIVREPQISPEAGAGAEVAAGAAAAAAIDSIVPEEGSDSDSEPRSSKSLPPVRRKKVPYERSTCPTIGSQGIITVEPKRGLRERPTPKKGSLKERKVPSMERIEESAEPEAAATVSDLPPELMDGAGEAETEAEAEAEAAEPYDDYRDGELPFAEDEYPYDSDESSFNVSAGSYDFYAAGFDFDEMELKDDVDEDDQHAAPEEFDEDKSDASDVSEAHNDAAQIPREGKPGAAA